MKTTYKTVILGFGNHAAIEIPPEQLAILGGNKRAPLKVTVKGYTYQSTAAGVNGKCLVVFPTKDRLAAGVASGDQATVTLELDRGYRQVDVPLELKQALEKANLWHRFYELNYSTRKEFARGVREAKEPETKLRRIEKVISDLKNLSI